MTPIDHRIVSRRSAADEKYGHLDSRPSSTITCSCGWTNTAETDVENFTAHEAHLVTVGGVVPITPKLAGPMREGRPGDTVNASGTVVSGRITASEAARLDPAAVIILHGFVEAFAQRLERRKHERMTGDYPDNQMNDMIADALGEAAIDIRRAFRDVFPEVK